MSKLSASDRPLARYSGGGQTSDAWSVVSISALIADITSGDWGKSEKGNDAEPALALRGTDFKNANEGSLARVPVRYLGSSSMIKRQVAPGDILVEMSGGSKDQPTGRALLVSKQMVQALAHPLVFSNFVKRLRLTQDRVDPAFFLYAWSLLYHAGRTKPYEKRTTGIRNFKLADFIENEVIHLPSLTEQRGIAHVLRTVQRAKEQTEHVIAATRELRRSLGQHLFTFGPTLPAISLELPLRETALGPLPNHWEVEKLGAIATTTSGGTPSRKVSHFFGGDIPWVKSGELRDGTVGTTEESLTLQGLDASNAKLVPKGTLLIALYGATAARVGLLAMEAATNQAVCAIFPDSRSALPSYLFHALMHQRVQLLGARYGGAQPNLSQTVVRNFLVPLPPLDEQKDISLLLSVVDRKIRAEEQRRDALDQLFKSFLHELMTGRIRLTDWPEVA